MENGFCLAVPYYVYVIFRVSLSIRAIDLCMHAAYTGEWVGCWFQREFWMRVKFPITDHFADALGDGGIVSGSLKYRSWSFYVLLLLDLSLRGP